MSYFLIGVGALLLYGAIQSALGWLKERALDEERDRQAKADMELLRKQSEIISEHKTAEDTARDLDSGSF